MSFLDPKYRIMHYIDGYNQHFWAVQHWRFWFPFWKTLECGYGYYTNYLTYDLEKDALEKKKQLEFQIEHKKKINKKIIVSYIY